MKLFTFPGPPNPTKVHIYLAEKGISVDTELVHLLKGQQDSEEFRAINPMGKVPVLELDDGSYITESLPIIEYFEELHPEPPLIGTSPAERAHVRALERLCDNGILAPAAGIVHATRSPLGLPPNPDLAARARKRLDQVLAIVDAKIGHHPFVAGERLTIADCTLCAGLHFARFGQVDAHTGFANIARWYEEFCQRPSAQIRPPASS